MANSVSGNYEVRVLFSALASGETFLNGLQFAHLMTMLRRLEEFGRPDAWLDLDVQEDGECFYFCERGGIFGQIQLRVFFVAEPVSGVLYIAEIAKKNVDAPNALGDLTLARVRARTGSGGATALVL